MVMKNKLLTITFLSFMVIVKAQNYYLFEIGFQFGDLLMNKVNEGQSGSDDSYPLLLTVQ